MVTKVYGCPPPSTRRAILRDAPLDDFAKRVLWEISEAMDARGETWVARATIASRASLSARTVASVVAWAKSCGVLIGYWRDARHFWRLSWRALATGDLPGRTAGRRKVAKHLYVIGCAPPSEEGAPQEAVAKARGALSPSSGRTIPPLGAHPITLHDHAESDHANKNPPTPRRGAPDITPQELTLPSYLDLYPELQSPPEPTIPSARRLDGPVAAPTSENAPTFVPPAIAPPWRRRSASGEVVNLATARSGQHVPDPTPQPDDDQLVYEHDDAYQVDDVLRPGRTISLPPTLQELFAHAPGHGIAWISAFRDQGVTTTRDLYELVAVEKLQYVPRLGVGGRAMARFLAERWLAPLRDGAELDSIASRGMVAAFTARDERAEKEQAAVDAGVVVRLGVTRG